MRGHSKVSASLFFDFSSYQQVINTMNKENT